MSKYMLKTQYNKYACEDQVVPVEDVLGDWVKWIDVCDFMTKTLHNNVNLQMNIDIQNVVIMSLRKDIEELKLALNI